MIPDSAKPEKAKHCSKCEYAIFQDTGYSNWTVEGREFFCSKKVHPEDGFDSWYYEDERLNFGENCKEFSVGEPIDMDVDQDAIIDLSPSQKIIWEKFNKKEEK